MYKLAVLSAAFVGSTIAAPAIDVTVDARFGGKNCRDIKVPVTVDTFIKQFNYKATDEEIDTTNLFLASVRHGSDSSSIVANVRATPISFHTKLFFCQ
ncbi:hypothetical protein NQ176_g10094 [Zarea fungicola]|uniref:Uncharacterized protein n=1 Tax=Zarea fungicola TaxID=93591 RepID=A0ACC1MK04_9HYPO|nr:hypothetical protein NQ176_g10094 [Lecanicillium fungicola]